MLYYTNCALSNLQLLPYHVSSEDHFAAVLQQQRPSNVVEHGRPYKNPDFYSLSNGTLYALQLPYLKCDREPGWGKSQGSSSPVFSGVDVGQMNRAVAVDDIDIRLW